MNTCEARCFAELQSDPGSRDICCVEAWKLTDGECHPFLQCYCEEKNSPPCMPPVSICSARWARASSESWRGCRVVCTLNPAPPLPGSTSPRIPSCDRAPVLFSGESCLPVGEVSPPPLPLPLQTSQCIAGTVSPSSSNWCHINIMPPTLRVGQLSWSSEALDMHPHQVPHAQCCPSGDVHSCTGECRPGRWVGDDHCDADLECYCEEKASPPCKPPGPDFSARWARCQNPFTACASRDSWRCWRVVWTLNPCPSFQACPRPPQPSPALSKPPPQRSHHWNRSHARPRPLPLHCR